MQSTARFASDQKRLTALALLCMNFVLGQGCGRSEPLRPTGAASSLSQQKLPFHSETDRTLATDNSRPAIPPDPKLASAAPFHAGPQPRTLPLGTLLTVQLSRSLSASKTHVGDVFTASVVAPLTVDGNVWIDRGTPVSGLIESSQPADPHSRKPGSGYFQLTLDALTLNGRQITLQTSSLFARGTPLPANVSSHSGGVGVRKGRRLTFWLTAPVDLDNSQPKAADQYGGAISE